jgi:hypothetical protein
MMNTVEEYLDNPDIAHPNRDLLNRLEIHFRLSTFPDAKGRILVNGSSGELSPPVSEPPESSCSMVWRATDEAIGRRILAPDGKSEYVFFAYILRGLAGIQMPNKEMLTVDVSQIKNLIWNDVNQMYTADRSLVPYRGYRPTGFNNSGDRLVQGWYSRDAGLWSWFAIRYDYWADQNSCASIAHDMFGQYVAHSFNWGWTSIVNQPAQLNYPVVFRYADVDREHGIHFSIGFA